MAVLSACAGSSSADGPDGTGSPATTSSEVPTTGATATVPGATTATPTTVPVTPLPPTSGPVADANERIELGRSVEGRPIMAVRRGTPGGKVVLVIGVIHGDEDAGVAIVDRLATQPVPPGIDLWLVESINPDGQAKGIRHNAHQVDLNRNFPFRWAPLGQPGDWQYGGPSAGSEPETQATVALIERIQPDLALWYHQDLFRIAPSTGREGRIRREYAQLTGLPVLAVTGGTYTGVAATWQRNAVPDGVAFIVELGPTLSATEADTHAAAVLTIARS